MYVRNLATIKRRTRIHFRRQKTKSWRIWIVTTVVWELANDIWRVFWGWQAVGFVCSVSWQLLSWAKQSCASFKIQYLCFVQNSIPNYFGRSNLFLFHSIFYILQLISSFASSYRFNCVCVGFFHLYAVRCCVDIKWAVPDDSNHWSPVLWSKANPRTAEVLSVGRC